jgi:hypothetical protein
LTVYNTITGIKNDIKSKLPAILIAAGLYPFDEYVAGFPQDQTKKILAVWYSEHRRSTENNFVFNIQAQLTATQEEYTYKYLDAIESYLKNNTLFVPESYGFASVGYDCMLLTNFDNGQCSIFFDVTLNDPLDDCD